MNPLIVADIGGTNARFGIVSQLDPGSGSTVVEQERHFQCGDFASFESVLDRYIDLIEGARPEQACFAVAGPVEGNAISMTNQKWHISGPEIMSLFDLRGCHLINDYTALSFATLCLGDDDVVEICAGHSAPGLNRCIVGPGTGLGVGGMTLDGDRWVGISGQGGHVNLAGTGAIENTIIQHVAGPRGVIQAEEILSGPGIRRLYKAVCEVSGHPQRNTTPEEITAAASAGSDRAATKTFSIFFRLLGGLAGDFALTLGARGGVYLAGGILPRVQSLLIASEFEDCFREKGVMSDYMQDIRVSLIISKNAALKGAARWAANVQKRD